MSTVYVKTETYVGNRVPNNFHNKRFGQFLSHINEHIRIG